MTGEFEVRGPIGRVQLIAVGRRIRILSYLQNRYGKGRWRKLKGQAVVCLDDGTLHLAEVQWYEMSLVGRKRMKIKRLLT